MTAQQIESLHREISEIIDRKEIKLAFSKLHEWLRISPEWEAEEQLKQWETTYKYMLIYFSKGNPDPEREKVYKNLVQHLYTLVDSITDAQLLKESPTYFFDRKRYLNYSSRMSVADLIRRIDKSVTDISLAELLEAGKAKDQKMSTLIHAIDNDLSELFLYVWLSDKWQETDEYRLLFELNIPEKGLCLMVSAITLSLLRRFDAEKCLWLMDAAMTRSENVKQRALVGLLLVFNLYRTRLSSYPLIAHRFEALSEKKGISTDFQNIILHLIRSRETEKISRKLTDEILPEMMKLSPSLRKKMNLEDWNQESNDEDKNPDWQEIFEQSGLNDKLKELSELQMDGSDVFMTTFSGLKSFPFFYNISSWFLPFSLDHSAFLDIFLNKQSDSSMFDSIMNSGVLCNSDKFSLCFSLQQMPEEQRRMLIQQFTGEGMNQSNEEEELLKNNKQGEIIARQYIQDLYRFFKLHPHRSDFYDVFAQSMHYHSLPIMQSVISNTENLRVIAEFFFRKEFYSDALEVFEQLIVNEHGNSELYQKIGYCYQMLNDDNSALKSYLKADVIYPGSAWTIRRIAQCYRRLKQPDHALEYYQRYDKLMPDTINVILHIGHCYLEQKNYSEALKFYFKADYLDSSNPRTWRPIAWCSFLVGKFDQAEKYYQKVLRNKPIAQDFMNLGHVLWAQKDAHQAAQYYIQSINVGGGNWDRFKEAFTEDVFELRLAGVEADEVSMMLDQLQYQLETK